MMKRYIIGRPLNIVERKEQLEEIFLIIIS